MSKKITSAFSSFFIRLLLILFISPCLAIAQEDDNSILPPGINTPDATERYPSITADGRHLVWSRVKDGNVQFFEAFNTDGVWGQPQPIDFFEGVTEVAITDPAISPDGYALVFSAQKAGDKTFDIYMSKRSQGTWLPPEPMAKIINTSHEDERHPAISPDYNNIYFSRTSSRTADDLDLDEEETDCFELYTSRKDNEGNWQQTVLLDPPVRYGCELAPRILGDDLTLFFSSYKEGGEGNFDLYVSNLDRFYNWASPKIITEVSGKAAEKGSAYDVFNNRLYYSEDGDIKAKQLEQSRLTNDYLIVNGKVTDQEGAPLGATVKVFNHETTQFIYSAQSDAASGEFTLVLPETYAYRVIVEKEGYSRESKLYDLLKMDEVAETPLQVQLFNTISYQVNVHDEERFTPLSEVTAEVQGVSGEFKGNESGVLLLDLPINQVNEVTLRHGMYHDTTFQVDLNGAVQFRKASRIQGMRPQKDQLVFTLMKDSTTTEEGMARIHNPETHQMFEFSGMHVQSFRNKEPFELHVPVSGNYWMLREKWLFDDDIFERDTLYKDELGQWVVRKQDTLQVYRARIDSGKTYQFNDVFFHPHASVLAGSSYQVLREVALLNNFCDSLQLGFGVRPAKRHNAVDTGLYADRTAVIKNYLLLQGLDTAQLHTDFWWREAAAAKDHAPKKAPAELPTGVYFTILNKD